MISPLRHGLLEAASFKDFCARNLDVIASHTSKLFLME